MIVAASGHRPPKLGGYHDEPRVKATALAVEWIKEHHPTTLIVGMALGWDTAVAQAAIICDVPYIAALPFIGQETAWHEPDRDRFDLLLKYAESTVVVSPGTYTKGKMHARNRWMVDHAQRMLVLFDGTAGGTSNCVEYAHSKGVPVSNLWSTWRKT